MSATVGWADWTTRTATCPGWCAEHRTTPDGEAWHRGIVEHGEFTGQVAVHIDGFNIDGEERVEIVPPDLQWVDAAGARDLAAALVKAAQVVEGATV